MKRQLRKGIAAALVAGATAACGCPLTPDDGRTLAGDGIELAWAPAGQRVITVSEAFAIDVRACPADADLLAVDAVMPAHRHGMNYRPSISAVGPGRWRVDGLLWHMRGRWELRFELRRDGRIQTLRQPIDLP